MPMKSKLVIAAFVALFLLTAATLLCSVAWAGGGFWGLTAMSVLIAALALLALDGRSEEHTSELQSLMRISYAVFCLKKKNHIVTDTKCNTEIHSDYHY